MGDVCVAERGAVGLWRRRSGQFGASTLVESPSTLDSPADDSPADDPTADDPAADDPAADDPAADYSAADDPAA